MQKKLTVLFAFAIFVLLVGWAITPAQADPSPHGHPTGGNGNDETFFVDLTLGMEMTGLQVTVIQDSSKKIHFKNTNFSPPDPGIQMIFDIPEDPEDNDCFVSRGDLTPDDDLFADLVAELTGAVIDSGRFVVEVDKKKETGVLIIGYTSDALGQIVIKYGTGGGFAPVVEEVKNGDTRTYHFVGTIIVWQLGEDTPSNQIIVGCPEVAVDVTLYSSAGQQ